MAPKADTLTIATSVVAGFGIGLTTGFAVMVDVGPTGHTNQP